MTERVTAWLLILLLAASGSALAQAQEVPQGLQSALKAKGPAILYSIFPEPGNEGEMFLGYPVLESAVLSERETDVITRSVLSGLTQAESSLRHSCFAPRHALLLSNHKLLICYACHSVSAELPDGQRVELAITDSGHKELAQAVFDHNLPWQGWQPVGDGVRHHRSDLAAVVPEHYEARGATGSDTLTLESRIPLIQPARMPGTLVLVSQDGDEEVIPTEWLDHALTGKTAWYLAGLRGSFEPSANRREFRGSATELLQLKSYFTKTDQRARRVPWVRIRPTEDGDALKIQQHKMRLNGYLPKDTVIEGVHFKVAQFEESGMELESFAGLVPTAGGPVLVTAELPQGQPNPLSNLVRGLLNRE
jgi:hypothetical protein